MKIQYNGSSKILKRLVELVNRSQNVALRQDNTDKNTLYWTGLDGVEITVNIPSGAVEVDTELSETSTNPVENQAITKELAQKADKSAIPTVGDGVLSVQRNGKSVGTFSANAAENEAINIPVPEKVSELENDAGYGTYTKPADGIPKSDLASGVQASLGKADTALQKHQDISGKLDKTGDASTTTVAFSAASARENVKTGEKLSVIVGKIAKWFADLKTVAFTGSYNDLANKPTIPDISGKQDKLTAGTNITISGNTISAKDTTYTSKSAVSGGKDVSLVTTGEKAIWNAKTSNVGTITGIKMNGASKGTSGVVDLGTVITAHQDISGKQDKSTAVTHSANTAVGSATKPVYVAANGIATPISHSINSDVPANAKFTDTTYSDATQSTHGLMTAADKKKLDGVDLSKYLPLAGGVMTGDIDMQTNKRDILVGTHKANTSDGTAVAGGAITTPGYVGDKLKAARSFVGTVTGNDGVWWNAISVRHRNGYNDGVNYGMYLISALTSSGNLIWNKQTYANTWQGDRTLLDSVNYTSYAAKSDHAHAMITNSTLKIDGANNAAQWVCLGTLVSGGDARSALIRVWSGDGFNGNANQNASFEIQIKDGYQSTPSADRACGVTVYRINCSTAKVKVIPTKHNTYTVWVYLPWAYWNGNYAVYGRYTSWTQNGSKQTAEPEGTAADTAYYDQAFLTSTVANATTWNGLINDVDTYNSSDTWILVKKDNRIQHRYAGELDVNSAKTLVDSGWQKPTFPSGVKSSSIRYRKQGKIVSVTGYVQFSTAQTTITVFTLPTGYRPPAKIQQFNAVDSSAQASFLTKIDTDGKVGFFGKTQGFFTTATEYYMHCTFFVD